MTAQQSKAKTCSVCGQDVSSRPRTKDRAGHYFCNDCYDKLTGRPQTPAPSAEKKPRSDNGAPANSNGSVDLSVIAKLAEFEKRAEALEPDAVECKSCGTEAPRGTRLCPRCRQPLLRIKKGQRPTMMPGSSARAATAAGGSRGTSLAMPEFLKNPWIAFVVGASILAGVAGLILGF